MSKTGAVVQVIVVVALLVYSTFHFYRGNFDLALSILPLLMLYYVFIIGKSRRIPPSDDDESSGEVPRES
jgi:hypothetical protein